MNAFGISAFETLPLAGAFARCGVVVAGPFGPHRNFSETICSVEEEFNVRNGASPIQDVHEVLNFVYVEESEVYGAS